MDKVENLEQDVVLPEDGDLSALCGGAPMLIATVGLPASGKTTWSRQLLAEAPCFVRVNSDDLRAEHPHAREAYIWRLLDERIKEALSNSKSVVVDNTNLHGWSGLRRLARQHSARLGVRDFRNVTWQECVTRDKARASKGERTTGRSVIIKMAMQAKLFTPDPSTNKEAVIIDLDGTLSDTAHRIHHITGGAKQNWKEFFAGIEDDTVIRAIETLYKMAVTANYTVLFVTSRPEDYRAASERWLLTNGFDDYFALFMRSQSDNNKPDFEVKGSVYDRFIAPYFDVIFAVDDRPPVVEMWRARGLACLQVAGDDA